VVGRLEDFAVAVGWSHEGHIRVSQNANLPLSVKTSLLHKGVPGQVAAERFHGQWDESSVPSIANSSVGFLRGGKL
jgi:hypothetical protein